MSALKKNLVLVQDPSNYCSSFCIARDFWLLFCADFSRTSLIWYQKHSFSRVHSLEHSFQWWNFRSRDQSFPGTFVPGNEWSMEHLFLGPFVPWTISSLDRILRGTFLPWNMTVAI